MPRIISSKFHYLKDIYLELNIKEKTGRKKILDCYLCLEIYNFNSFSVIVIINVDLNKNFKNYVL